MIQVVNDIVGIYIYTVDGNIEYFLCDQIVYEKSGDLRLLKKVGDSGAFKTSHIFSYKYWNYVRLERK